jgi:hypothetical protein
VFEHLEDVPTWAAAARGEEVDWSSFPPDCVAAVDWPASAFWRELADANPDALILLSTRQSAAKWWESADETIFPVIRGPVEPENEEWKQMALALLGREIGEDWDNAERAQAFYERHNDEVRREAPPERLLEWRAEEGWEPICQALGLPVPDKRFPRVNTREEWRARHDS